MCYETYHETIIEIIEEKLFNFITYDNVNNFVSPKLKEKLLLEYSKKGMIKEEFEKTEGNLLDQEESKWDFIFLVHLLRALF